MIFTNPNKFKRERFTITIDGVAQHFYLEGGESIDLATFGLQITQDNLKDALERQLNFNKHTESLIENSLNGKEYRNFDLSSVVNFSNARTVTIKAWRSVVPGLGTNNKDINCLKFVGSDLYIGGKYNVTSIATKYWGKWDGSAFSLLGGDVDDIVRVIEKSNFDSNIYVGGNFRTVSGGTMPMTAMTKWNGTNYSNVGQANFGNGSYVSCFAFYKKDVFVGGSFGTLTPAGKTLLTVNNIARTTDETSSGSWTDVGMTNPGFNKEVYCMLTAGTGNLYIGGGFSSSFDGSITLRSIAMWSRSNSYITEIGSGTNGVVRCMAMSGTDLYVGGEFTTVSAGTAINANRIAKWDGTNWHALGTGFTKTVRGLKFIDSNLYAVGDFLDGIKGDIAMWDGSDWYPVDSGTTANSAYAIEEKDNELYIGGTFGTFYTYSGNATINGLAKWDLT